MYGDRSGVVPVSETYSPMRKFPSSAPRNMKKKPRFRAHQGSLDVIGFSTFAKFSHIHIIQSVLNGSRPVTNRVRSIPDNVSLYRKPWGLKPKIRLPTHNVDISDRAQFSSGSRRCQVEYLGAHKL